MRNRRPPDRWYGRLGSWTGDVGPFQLSRKFRARVRENDAPVLPMPILALAAQEYNDQGYSQSLQRLNERGGLSDMEIIALLADRCERLARSFDTPPEKTP